MVKHKLFFAGMCPGGDVQNEMKETNRAEQKNSPK